MWYYQNRRYEQKTPQQTTTSTTTGPQATTRDKFTNRNQIHKRDQNPNRSIEVYAKGADFASSIPVKICVIPDGKEALLGNAVASADATTGADGTLPNTLVWSPMLTVGNYDLWVDANKNGVYDAGDALNDASMGIKPFFVVPEPAIIP